MNVNIPADVPESNKKIYLENYNLITHGTGRLMLFAGDQKIEHLNDDFYGQNISPEDNDPEHLFKIASKAKIGVFAAQLGLIARYGSDYSSIPYLVKLNSKTHLVKTAQSEPLSSMLYEVDQVIEFQQNSGLKIAGVGYTVYLGSEYEAQMLSECAQVIYEAHQHGLITVIWCYPRGKAVTNESDAHLIAGASGAMACLGADFVKVNPPKNEGKTEPSLLKEATKSAGRTQVVCAGGSSKDVRTFLEELYAQIHTGGTSGNATGRNIHQKPLDEAISFANAIYAVTVEDKTVEEAMSVYNIK